MLVTGLRIIKDGYSDLKNFLSYEDLTIKIIHDWQVNTEDLNKNNGKMRICEYTI